MRFKLVHCFAIAAAGLLAAFGVRAQSQITLTISNSPGRAIPRDFAGLGFEENMLRANQAGVSGYFFSPTNSELITLFRNAGVRHLRIGGGTVDGLRARPPTRAGIDNLFGFARAAGVKVIFSLKLLNGNTATDAVIARYVCQNYQPLLDHLAIGNEPDEPDYRYPPFGKGTDPAITNYATYLAKWRKFAAAVTNAVPGATFAAPDTGGLPWNTNFANDEKSSGLVALFTTHDYFGGKWQGQTSDTAASNMLSARWVNKLYPKELNGMSRVVADGYPYRLTELNDYLGGVTNASNAFASALWALDVLHWWAAHGAAGANFHNNEWLLTDTIHLDKTDGSYQINPKAYGIRAFDLGSHGRVEPLSMANPDNLNVTAYAVADRARLYVTIINKQYGADAREAVAALRLDGFRPAGRVAAMFLCAPGGNVEATTGVTLGGGAITNNAPWHGKWKLLGIVRKGEFTVTVPPASAAVLRMAVVRGASRH